jgi:hypothetical protein
MSASNSAVLLDAVAILAMGAIPAPRRRRKTSGFNPAA